MTAGDDDATVHEVVADATGHEVVVLRGNAVALAATLGVDIGDERWLQRALVHRSWSFEHGGVPTNERLEFLGDAVLGLVATDAIFHRETGAEEGRLAKVRSATVRTDSLADLARELRLGEYVLLGRGEEATGGADKASILADTFEAVLGAVYVDRGWEVASALIRRLLADRLDAVTEPGAALDAKTALQERTAAASLGMPRYEVTGTGPDHERVFTATVIVADQPAGSGTGRNKKIAEQAAAREALDVLDTLDPPDGTAVGDGATTGSEGGGG